MKRDKRPSASAPRQGGTRLPGANARPTGGRKAPSSAAPGQYLGFSLQTTRAVAHLLDGAPGTVVSVEVFEDIGVEATDGGKLAEQAKSALAHNPLADRAVDLWKTFANWTRGVQCGDIAVESTRFVLCVSPPRRPGDIAKSFASASDAGTALAALVGAREALWGAPPKHRARAKVAASLAPYLETVFSAPEDMVKAIIERFELAKGDRDPIAEIESRIAQKFVSEQHVPVVAQQALGWAKARIDRLIQAGKLAMLPVDDFQAEMTAFVIKVDRSLILNSFAPMPAPEVVEAELPQRQYIKQLGLIGSDDAEKLRAANDYLRAAYDRSEWATKGIVHRSSIEEFQDQLVRVWESKRQISALEMEGRAEELVGRHVFASCSTVSAELQGLKPPAHFTSGCYHSLSDETVVGWHPRYKDLLAPPPSPGKT